MDVPEIARPMGKREKKWMNKYKELIDYDNNNNAIPRVSPGNKLGTWCSQQRTNYRKKKLSKKRIELLNKISNWYWEKYDSFMINYNALKQYEKTFHRMPSQIDGNISNRKLGKWCSRTKQQYSNGKLATWKINLLESINGWCWGWDNLFMVHYAQLKDYIKNSKYKILYIYDISKNNKTLNSWTKRQRNKFKNNKLATWKINLLESINGWFWYIKDQTIPFDISVASRTPQINKYWDYENNDFNPKNISQGSHQKINLKCKICCYSWKVSAYDFTSICFNGCPLCNGSISRGEREIMEAFDRLDRIGTPQHIYPGCFHKNPLHFDNAILNQLPIDILFEGDGRQHFGPIDYFGGQEGYNDRRICDIKKNKFCIENKLILLRISYTEKYESEKWIKLAIEKANRNEYGIIYSNPKLYETAYFHKIKTFIAIRTLQRRWRFKHYIPIKN